MKSMCGWRRHTAVTTKLEQVQFDYLTGCLVAAEYSRLTDDEVDVRVAAAHGGHHHVEQVHALAVRQTGQRHHRDAAGLLLLLPLLWHELRRVHSCRPEMSSISVVICECWQHRDCMRAEPLLQEYGQH